MEEEKEEGEEEEEMKEEQSTSGSESSRVRERHYEVRTVGFPKSLLKVMVAGENGDLLGELRGALELVVVLVSHCCGDSGYEVIVNMFMSHVLGEL